MSEYLRGPRSEVDELTGQRRQLTVMFCDLADSTKMSLELDPEDLGALTQSYYDCCREHIEEAGGFVALYMGDGILAYFGYPEAHEDDPERAIHAGLLVAENVPKLPDAAAPLLVRVGIATGVVVIGELIGSGTAEERAIVGVTPNLAARLQAAAAPNCVVVSDATRSLARGLFDFSDLGPLQLKGFNVEETAWQVIGPRGAADRFRARQGKEIAPLVGRAEELELILERWRRCASGEGQIIGLVGEPGIGKSRLVHQLRREAREPTPIWLEGGGGQVFRNTPLYAIAQMVRQSLGGRRGISTNEYLPALKRALALAEVRTEHALALIADLLGVATSVSDAPVSLSAADRRRYLLDALVEWLLNSSSKRPLIVFVEDLHWADPSTLELLDRLVPLVPFNRIFFIYTSRSDMSSRWPAGPAHCVCTLGRMPPHKLRELVKHGIGREVQPDLLDYVVARADGVPLFAEELARLIGLRPEGSEIREIPGTLSDLLMARLDQLGPAKKVAQFAAVLGTEFQLEVLSAMMGQTISDLSPAVAVLSEAEVLVRRETDDGRYAFRHTLIQDAAYQALLRRHRKELHARAALVLAEDFPSIASAHPELLAQHWVQAGEPELALAAWEEAGATARQRHAYQEAEYAYSQAVALLVGLPQSPRRDEREIKLQTSLIQLLQSLRGYSHPDTIAAALRARQLAESGGHLPQRIQQLVSLWSATSSAGDYDRGGELADQLLQLGYADGSPQAMGAGHMATMTLRYRTGDLVGAEQAFAAGRQYFASPDYYRRPGAAAQTFGTAALVAWLLGDEREVRRRVERALVLCQDNTPLDLAFGHLMAAEVAVLTSRYEDATRHADESLRVAGAHEFEGFMAMARVMLGRVRCILGDPMAGLALMQQGLQNKPRSAAQMTMYSTWIAETQAEQGLVAAAMTTFDEALTINARERYFRPETLRLRATLRRSIDDGKGAEADLQEAVATAKQIGSPLLHDRAMSDLRSHFAGNGSSGWASDLQI